MTVEMAPELKPKGSNWKAMKVSGVKVCVIDKWNKYKGPEVKIWLVCSMNSKETSVDEMNKKAENKSKW